MRFPCLRYDFALPPFLLRFNSASKPFQLPFIEWDLHGICNGFTTDLQGINNASPMLKLTIITNLTNLFNLYLNTEFTEQTKVIRFFRAFSVQIKTTFMEKIG